MSLIERLADLYFRPKAFEGRGKIYVYLGVLVFKRALLKLARPAPGAARPSYWLTAHDADGLRAFERRTRRNEAIHLLALVPPVLGLALSNNAGPLLVSVFVAVIALNFHPILLQRYNRIRIYRVLARAEVRLAD